MEHVVLSQTRAEFDWNSKIFNRHHEVLEKISNFSARQTRLNALTVLQGEKFINSLAKNIRNGDTEV